LEPKPYFEVFVAERNAKFTLIKNSIANSLKILLLILLVNYFGSFAIFSSTGLAAFLAVVVSLFWFLPRLRKQYFPSPVLSKDALNPIIRYSIGNHFSFLFWGLPTLIFPLMVINVLGADANAYFYIVWSIGAILCAIPEALSTSLFAEGSHEENSLRDNIWRVTKTTSLMLIPLILLLVFLGDKLLLLFGQDYAREGAFLIKIIALSAIPFSINNFYISVKRIKKQTRDVIYCAAAIACFSIGLSYPLIMHMGLNGIGLSWLIGQGVVAAVVLIVSLFPLIRSSKKSLHS
jgi:O-antigen/teichoic acid export membrane protein